jgi:glycogen debranching enzyme
MIRPNVPWIEVHTPELKGKILVTLSMEGCIAELKGDAREANVRGGLGIYFGDKLEGLSTIGLRRAFGCMPLYKKRLVQSIRNGRQHIEYVDVSYEDQPITSVTDRAGKPMEFDVWGWESENTACEKQYRAKVYNVSRGGTSLCLFYCPEVFDVLYPDDKTHPGRGREHRFLQETIFAECVYELLKCLNVVPDVLHLNEGHVADAAAIIKGDDAFDKTAVVYTNHTVVPAGLERFSVDGLTDGDVARARYAMRFHAQSHQRFWKRFSMQQDGHWLIDFSKGALETCDVANGVSAEHADATQALFADYDGPVEPVLNGSGDAWIMDELLEAKLKGIKPGKEILRGTSAQGKARSLAEVKSRTAGMTDCNGQIITKDGVTLDRDLPTVWLVRRMVEYKSQLPVLRDIIHVVCANRDEEVDTMWGRMRGLAMQVVVGGIAPQGSNEEGWIEEFVRWMQRPELRRRFVFVPNADSTLLKMQAIGADICINCPLPEHEACGTSDQRSAMNGGINIATRSGGPPEYIEDGRSGMLVGPYENNDDFYARAPRDILGKLEELSDMYYDHNNGDTLWLDMKLESYLASPKVTAAAMEQRYATVYARAIRKSSLATHHSGAANSGFEFRSSRLPDGGLFFGLQEASRGLFHYDPALRGWTVIAGLPYFDQRQGGQFYNWGRDTMASLPGLCLESDRSDLFRDIMVTYLRFVRDGLLPNIIGDGSQPRYNSVDASLWLLWAMGKYLERTRDYAFLDTPADRRFHSDGSATVRNVLEEIIHAYRNGIWFEDIWPEDGIEKHQTIRISMDRDCLITAGDENTQLTWMDVRPAGCAPVTSRHGKAVEVSALWYNALRVMEDIDRHAGGRGGDYAELAEKVKSAFVKFWNPRTCCLYDTIDGDPEQGEKIRPNQVFAVALGLLDAEKSLAVMNKVTEELLTPFGLRTLSPHDPNYCAVHWGEYSHHQGTVWPWLMGAFIEGAVKTYGRTKALSVLNDAGYFAALAQTLDTFGSIPEVFDGGGGSIRADANGKGCVSHAWNVAETLRGLSLLSLADGVGAGITYEIVVRDHYHIESYAAKQHAFQLSTATY